MDSGSPAMPAVRQTIRAAQAIFAGPGLRLVHLLLEVLDRRGGPFEQLVDVVAVIATPRLANLNVAQLLGADVHGSHGGQW